MWNPHYSQKKLGFTIQEAFHTHTHTRSLLLPLSMPYKAIPLISLDHPFDHIIFQSHQITNISHYDLIIWSNSSMPQRSRTIWCWYKYKWNTGFYIMKKLCWKWSTFFKKFGIIHHKCEANTMNLNSHMSSTDQKV